MSHSGRRGVFCLALTGVFFALVATSVQGQGLSRLTEVCGGDSADLLQRCGITVRSAQAAQSAVGLAASQGSDVTGSASTLGWRLKGSPRYALHFRGSVVRSTKNRLTATSFGAGEHYTLFAGQIGGSVGVFDGFSPAPTIGGVLSLDLTASGHLVSAPRKSGFRESALGWGAGARIGILRESFTLPGLSVSGYYRQLGTSGLGDVAGGDPAAARFQVDVSSFRAVLGKDLSGVGVMGGVGWDRYEGDAKIQVVRGSGDDPGAGTAVGRLSSDRFLCFLGGTLTYLVLQASMELGWGQGPAGDLPAGVTTEATESSGSYFGSVSFRLTF